MHRGLLVILSGALLLAAAPLEQIEAQRPGIRERERHRGFWLGFGAGGGWDDFQWDFGNRGRSAALYLRMGGTVNQHVLVGAELIGLNRDELAGEFTRGNVMASALLYPARQGGWFLKTGFGFAGQDFAGFEQEGVGASIGTGFDFRMGRNSNFYITPNVDVLVQFFDNNTNAALLFTLGATWH